MDKLLNSFNKLVPIGKKAKKYLPFFIGFKLLTFTGFLTYMMNRQMVLIFKKFVIFLILARFGCVINFDVRSNPLRIKN